MPGCELSATLATHRGLVVLLLLGVPVPGITEPFPVNLFSVAAITTVIWLLATFMTRPTEAAKLDAFLPEGQTRRRRMETRSGPKSGECSQTVPCSPCFSTGLPGWYWYTWSFSA